MKLILKEKKQEAGDAMSFVFASEEVLVWRAGQFLHYLLPHAAPDDRGTERWFTISSAPFEKRAVITTRFAGDPSSAQGFGGQGKSSSFKRALFALPVGGAIEVDAPPDGDFIIDDEGREFLFIAGGIGITPFHSMLLELDHRGIPIKGKLLYANRSDDFVFKGELEALVKKHNDFTVRYFVAPERIDAAAIKEEAAGLAKPVFYVSGPEPMVESFEKVLGAMGVPEIDLKRDFFPGYEWPD